MYYRGSCLSIIYRKVIDNIPVVHEVRDIERQAGLSIELKGGILGRTGAEETRLTCRFDKYLKKKGFKAMPADRRKRAWAQADICMYKASQILICEVKAGSEKATVQTKRNNFDRGMSAITQRMVGYGNIRYALVLPDYSDYISIARNISPEFKRKNNFCIYIVPKKGLPFVLDAERGRKPSKHSATTRRRPRPSVASILETLSGVYSFDEIVTVVKRRGARTHDRQGLPHAAANALQALKKQDRARNVARGMWTISE